MVKRSEVEEQLRIERQFKSGCDWFYWIAALTLLNSVIFFFGGKMNFIVGLGITQAIEVLALESGGNARINALIINIFIAFIFVIFGQFSAKGKKWSFITGIALYTLDALFLLIFKDMIGIAFHGIALYGIFRGMQARDILVAEYMAPKETEEIEDAEFTEQDDTEDEFK